jgi:hypothetical protein
MLVLNTVLLDSGWPLPARRTFDVVLEHSEGQGGDFDSSFLEGLVGTFAFVQPEFANEDLKLDEATDVVCESAVEDWGN